ncbi:unnamed protein product [Caretta caretta]
MVALLLVSAAAAIVALRELLSQMRRKKRIGDDVFKEILQACTASENKTRVWRMTTAESVEKREAQESKQENEGDASGYNGASQVANRDASDSAGPVCPRIPCSPASVDHPRSGPPYTTPQHSTWHQRPQPYRYCSTQGDTKDNHSSTFTGL